MKKRQIAAMIEALDPGLERAVLRTLEKRVGREMAISRQELVKTIVSLGCSASDRAIRAKINELRKQGVLICSAGGHDGGYWLAKDRQEVDAFLGAEIRSKAMDLLETANAMSEAARERWGEGVQASMF